MFPRHFSNQFQPAFNLFNDLAMINNQLNPFNDFPSTFAFQTPPIDLHEKEKYYSVKVSLPGVSSKDLQVDFDESNYELRIKAATSQSNELQDSSEGTGKQLLSERFYGTFERRLVFPRKFKIDGDNIKASLVQGVLTLKVPKVIDETFPKKIAVSEQMDEESVVAKHGSSEQQAIKVDSAKDDDMAKL